MNRTIKAKLLRATLVAGGLFVVFLVVVGGADRLGVSEQLSAMLPFFCAAISTAVLVRLRSPIDRLVERLTRYREVTPYSALAEAAQRLRAGSLEQALPGLAQVLADGTGASRAVVWLAVGDRLVAAATHPAVGEAADPPDTAENLAVLLARPGTSHVEPVLEGSSLRAALVIDKPDTAVTPGDQVLTRDVANGAGLLLRGVALNAELSDRVRRADDLATELHASRQRLTHAREVERRRLLAELSRATTGRLAALREHVAAAQADLAVPGTAGMRARVALADARVELDELLDQFRIIARGVYPAVLRGQGPGAAIAELAADLPRPVILSGDVDVRLAWEIESSIYYVAAAVINALAVQPADRELRVDLSRADGRVYVQVEDFAATVSVVQLRSALADDAERLAALGGDLEWVGVPDPAAGDGADETGTLRLLAWLPDHLDPLFEGVTLVGSPRP